MKSQNLKHTPKDGENPVNERKESGGLTQNQLVDEELGRLEANEEFSLEEEMPFEAGMDELEMNEPFIELYDRLKLEEALVERSKDAFTRELVQEKAVKESSSKTKHWNRAVDTAKRKHALRDGLPKHKTMIKLHNSGNYRELFSLPTARFEVLDQLLKEFPNFYPVIEMIRRQAAIASHRKASPQLKFSPILMVGEPGIGKTVFSRKLAEKMGTVFEKIELSTVSAGVAISGLDTQWSNSQPGRILEALIRSRFGNPIILLDEIEKAASEDRHSPVLPALLGLLEPESARYFEDANLPGILIDASHILWLATANRLEDLRPELRDRFEVCQIAPLSKAQKRTFIRKQFQRLCQENEVAEVVSPLPPEAIELLSELNTRPLLRMLENLIGEALLSGHGSITLDLVRGLIDSMGKSKCSRPVGFVR